MRDREEEVLRHERIQFLSELLALRHKHRNYLKKAGDYDPLIIALENMEKVMASAKAARRDSHTPSPRYIVAMRARGAIETLLALGRKQTAIIRVGRKPEAKRHVKNRVSSYEINVGWMWIKKVWETLYFECSHSYGEWLILQAERVRVNSKYVELYEVLAFHKTSGDTVNGYVAKTKSPQKSCVFNPKAILAVKNAEHELERELDLLLKGTSNDEDT